MSNTNLIARMHYVLILYEEGKLRPDDVERSIDFHVRGLEQIGQREIDLSRSLMHRLVNADLSDGDDDFVDMAEVSSVLREFRSFLGSLPGASSV